MELWKRVAIPSGIVVFAVIIAITYKSASPETFVDQPKGVIYYQDTQERCVYASSSDSPSCKLLSDACEAGDHVACAAHADAMIMRKRSPELRVTRLGERFSDDAGDDTR